MNGNLPIPTGPQAPRTAAWYFTHAPFVAIIAAYRLIPAHRRRNWNAGVSTSHTAMAAVLAPAAEGGGRRAFARYATPQLRTRRQPGFVLAWALFLVSAAFGLNMIQNQSWAN